MARKLIGVLVLALAALLPSAQAANQLQVLASCGEWIDSHRLHREANLLADLTRVRQDVDAGHRS